MAEPATEAWAPDFLDAHTILRTRDLDEARSRVAEVFSPHALQIVQQSQQLDAKMCHLALGQVSISRLRYGATVEIDIGRTKDFVLVMMPLAGSAEVSCGNATIRSTTAQASVISPTLPLRMRSQYDADQIMVRIDRKLLERQCAQRLGHDLKRPIEFELGMDMSGQGGQGWQRLVRYLLPELAQENSIFTSPLMRAHIEQLVATTLLFAQPHCYRDELKHMERSVAPAFVRQVERYIAEHADQPLTVADLAASAGVSTSTLFSGFREFRNTSPMAYLRWVRLERVRAELQSNADITVTEAAVRWGFSHFGRFASEYKRRYGELPSATLRS